MVVTSVVMAKLAAVVLDASGAGDGSVFDNFIMESILLTLGLHMVV